MRHLAVSGLAALLLTGCGGSDSSGTAAKSAGIPLAIASTKQPEVPVRVTRKLDDYPAEIRTLLQRANAAVVAGLPEDRHLLAGKLLEIGRAHV